MILFVSILRLMFDNLRFFWNVFIWKLYFCYSLEKVFWVCFRFVVFRLSVLRMVEVVFMCSLLIIDLRYFFIVVRLGFFWWGVLRKMIVVVDFMIFFIFGFVVVFDFVNICVIVFINIERFFWNGKGFYFLFFWL